MTSKNIFSSIFVKFISLTRLSSANYFIAISIVIFHIRKLITNTARKNKKGRKEYGTTSFSRTSFCYNCIRGLSVIYLLFILKESTLQTAMDSEIFLEGLRLQIFQLFDAIFQHFFFVNFINFYREINNI